MTFASQMLDKYKPNNSFLNLLDIGAGYGPMKEIALKYSLNWFPVDYVQKIPESIIWDLDKPASDDIPSCHLAVLLEVLEHLSNPLYSLSQISEKIDTGGYLILSVPNPAWSKNKRHLLQHGVMYSFTPKHLKEHHVFTPWRHIVEYFLKEVGFEVVEYARIDGFKRTYNSLSEVIINLVELIMERFNPYSRGLSYGLVAKKIR